MTERNGFEPKLDPESKDFGIERDVAIGECGMVDTQIMEHIPRRGAAGRGNYVY